MKIRLYFYTFILFIMAASLISCESGKYPEEVQITHDPSYNHDLDNNDNFSPDDQWLVYDTRTPEGGIGACPKIEKVNVFTGEKKVLYELPQNQSYGPGVGAVSYSHTENKVVFIHGLLNITEENPYQQWHRTGVIVEDANPGIPVFMDARDITFPYTSGALRGGTHRHEWSGDGQWIGYTYNDAILKHLEDSTGEIHNLRTIGVSKNFKQINVDKDPESENVQGEWFSALVVKVVPSPTPGSDEISHAAGDSWVGVSGYKDKNGNTQRARAFIGKVKDTNGNDLEEVFIVDIPEDISIAGPDGPLEGTKTTFPMPPKGTLQRRLTHTENTKYPGCQGIVRSSGDGSKLAYLAKDENGITQVFTIFPLGGTPQKITNHKTDVQGNHRWHPNGKMICYILDKSICIFDLETNTFRSLTEASEFIPGNLVWSHDGKTIAYNRSMANENGEMTKQIFIIKL